MAINGLNETPNSLRLHIGIFGCRNSGKSSLINAVTGRELSIVSDTPGTTTDPVSKAIELHPLGACVLIDTAGFDDSGSLGEMRVERSLLELERSDMAVLCVPAGERDEGAYREWIDLAKKKKLPVVAAVTKCDLSGEVPSFLREFPLVRVSSLTKEGIDSLLEAIALNAPGEREPETITGHLVKPGDRVLLVAPQDINAPKGRLILPQVQTLRDLLDIGAIASIVTLPQLSAALEALKEPPDLIITDSQVFRAVKDLCPRGVPLTSFSVLMARYKGDILEYVSGAAAIDSLKEPDKVLVLEACAHNPMDGDIGREKIPAALRKRVGQGLDFETRAGNDIPDDLSPYSLVIHCGGCMFTRKHVLNRIARCKAAGVPVTNYGIALAKLAGILEDIEL